MIPCLSHHWTVKRRLKIPFNPFPLRCTAHSEDHPVQKSSDEDNDDLYCCPARRENDFKTPLSPNPFLFCSVMFDLGSFHRENHPF
ncbi:hypothetical protein CEXT_695761 [Caerostris extrusa]|uniref:Uncharacterized protein n=1 Tax=Caerostris extrusa TaxID=172846 RepID=A0AAV4PYC1_CAEEX|nr:hypothetical protein CEXT_695761 [Caerostris extrusa]